MLLYISSFIIFIVVSLSLFLRSSLPVWARIAGSAIILAVSLKYEIYQWLGGAFFAPQLPRSFLLLMEALYGSLIILFFLLLLYDLYLAGNWILGRIGIPVPTKIPTGWIKCLLCLLALAAGSWGAWQAVRVPDVRKVEMSVSGLPETLNGLSIVQLSDLHVGPMLKKDWLSEVVARANACNPDFIVLTGDYIDGRVNEISGEIEPLALLKARYGVFAITGNHEYYWNMKEWSRVIQDLGIVMLHNSHSVAEINGEKIVVAGLADLAALRFGMEGPDIGKALENAPEGLKILLDHQPRNARENGRLVDVQLSGHTHGGLVFFLQPLIARFNNGFVKGLYQLDNSVLYVHPGTGLWNGFSNRLGVPAEITNIILKPAS